MCEPGLHKQRKWKKQTFQPPSHANLEVLKNQPRKTWRLGPQTWRLQKYASNKNNNDRLFVSQYSLPNSSSLLYSFAALFALRLILQPWVSRCARYPLVVERIAVAPHQDTQAWRLSLAFPPFPSKISFDELNSAVMSTDFSIVLHTFRNFLAI